MMLHEEVDEILDGAFPDGMPIDLVELARLDGSATSRRGPVDTTLLTENVANRTALYVPPVEAA
jgi:hypothetical protein